VDELASLISDRTRLIILNSPQNPTGGVLTEQDIRDIAEVIGDRNIMVLSDEIYSRLVFDREHHSIMSVPGFQERTILLDGFSKTYAMTGWRLGYGVMRPDLANHVARLMTNSNSCTASFTQIAGIEALRGDQASVDQMRAEFRRRRDPGGRLRVRPGKRRLFWHDVQRGLARFGAQLCSWRREFRLPQNDPRNLSCCPRPIRLQRRQPTW